MKLFFLAFLKQTFYIKKVNMKRFDVLKNVSLFESETLSNFSWIRMARVGGFSWVSSESSSQVGVKTSAKRSYKRIL